MCKKIIFLLLVLFATGSYSNMEAGIFKKKKKLPVVAQKEKETPYQKLFKDKVYQTERGLFTIHKIDQKVYFEIPIEHMGKSMLLASTISEITDNSFGSVGEKPHQPLVISFVKEDSVVSLKKLKLMTYTKLDNLKERLAKSNTPATIQNFKIEAYNTDSSAVVIDITDYFVSDNPVLNPFSQNNSFALMGGAKFSKVFKKENSQILDIKAFSDNISIQSSLSYQVDLSRNNNIVMHQQPFTAVMTRSIVLLPEEPMRPRIADPRMGTFLGFLGEYTDKGKGVEEHYYITRWRLEPKDEEAFKRGELVEPKKPIVFYVDNAFPESWVKYVKQGVEEWQKAFEKIGFKNAIIAKDFPEDDPEFDPENIKYSCVRYSPSSVPNAMGPSWRDPRTGEIINANVSVYHNIAQLIQNWRFIHTSPADPEVRTVVLNDEIFGQSLRYVVAHEIGHCLGLAHNMGASAAIPSDSLRSPSYTQKYGTTHSIMDYARFNYVAQPGDKERGVKLTPPDLGTYDYYIISWMYTPILDAKNEHEEVKTLDKWVAEKVGDPVFRYGKEQFMRRYDPSSLSEDLGDDAMISGEYGIKNLKYILENMNDWVAADDKDGRFRSRMYNEVYSQYVNYLNHVIANVGGMYFTERYTGDNVASFKMVPYERQKRAVNFLFNELKDMSWLDNLELQKQLPINNNYAEGMRKGLFDGLLFRIGFVEFCQGKTSDKILTTDEYMRDIFNFVFNSTQKDKTLNSTEKELQSTYLSYLIKNAGIEVKEEKAQAPRAITNEGFIHISELTENIKSCSCCGSENHNLVMEDNILANFDLYVPITTPSGTSDYINYKYLKEAQKLIKQNSGSGNEDTKQHYRLMLFKIEKALK